MNPINQILYRYIIDENTFAIKPLINERFESVIIDKRGTYFLKRKPLDIVIYSCIFYKSTYEHGKRFISQTFKFKSKIPVPISLERNLYGFPTASDQSPHCEWYFANNIAAINERKNGTIIIFRDGKSVFTKVSANIIRNQFEKTFRCLISNKYHYPHVNLFK